MDVSDVFFHGTNESFNHFVKRLSFVKVVIFFRFPTFARTENTGTPFFTGSTAENMQKSDLRKFLLDTIKCSTSAKSHV